MAMANKHQKVNGLSERLVNELPDEIVLSSILSCFTIKQLARTRLVSRHWNRSLHHISVLNFEKSISNQNITSFVNRVNHVLRKHRGSSIDQFKVTFGLHNTYKSHIDRWVIGALLKNVKNLELDFYDYQPRSQLTKYFLHQPLIKLKPLLTSLCLICVDVTSQLVEQLLESCCSTLENLCIEFSDQLTSITVRNSLQSLKYFKVRGCHKLETIDISAPKLLSFTYELGTSFGFKLFRIANASSLSRVSIGLGEEERLVHAIGSLYSYFSHLEYLKLHWILYPGMPITVVNRPPVLANLKHLELSVLGLADRSIAGWIPFIEAFPLLEKLTLRLETMVLGAYRKKFKPYIHSHKRDRHPFRCLKTLEIIGFVGDIELDIAKYVVKKGVVLREVIIGRKNSPLVDRAPNFIMLWVGSILKMPPSVKLIVI